MTIPEAVTLVLQAFSIGKHGDLLVLDMGRPVRILDLARTLMKLSGVREDDVKIEFTGLRQGEKLHEELFYDYEDRRTTAVGKITLARSKTPNWNALLPSLNVLLKLGRDQMHSEIRRQAQQIVPEYEFSVEESSTQPQSIVASPAEPYVVRAD
jgi:FlaA1/EpsC-like NDP-sugar epimerase